MTRRIRIKTRETKSQFLRRLRKELSGITRLDSPNGRIIAAHIAESVYRDNWNEFQKKSRGFSDRFGVTWRPLANETIEDKLVRNRGVQRPGFVRPGRSRKGKKVPGIVSRKTVLTRGGIFIGVDTTEMAESLQPGKLAGGIAYIPRKGQIYRVQGRFVKLGTMVRHAKYFNAVRPIGLEAHRAKEPTRRGVANGIRAIANKLARTRA